MKKRLILLSSLILSGLIILGAFQNCSNSKSDDQKTSIKAYSDHDFHENLMRLMIDADLPNTFVDTKNYIKMAPLLACNMIDSSNNKAVECHFIFNKNKSFKSNSDHAKIISDYLSHYNANKYSLEAGNEEYVYIRNVECKSSFSDVKETVCTYNSVPCESIDQCIPEDSYVVVQDFKVGAGKVDILFVDDNSASMAEVQKKLAAKFGGFIEALDRKDIDYQIGITTTDITKSPGLVSFSNGQKVLKKSDSNRIPLFNGAIVRTETAQCEQFIKSAYESNPSNFDQTQYYYNNYSKYCPSGDERGIYTAHYVLSANESSLLRENANLNVIVISNEDERSGSYLTDSAFALAEKDKASNLIQMINSTYPSKYWEFNSIITKDASCASQQQQSFTGSNGQPIKSSNGNYIIQSNIGLEYAAVSSSSSQDIDGNANQRGQNFNICSNDYTSYFSNIAAKISDSARLFTLQCKPLEAPVITDINGISVNVAHVWNGDNKIIFARGSEGTSVKITYSCIATEN